MEFRHLTVTGITHRYIIIIIGATLHSLIISDTKSNITGTGKYLIIQRTLFIFRKKFATTGSKRKYISYKETKKCSQH